MAEQLTEKTLRALVAQWVRAALGDVIEEESGDAGEGALDASLPAPCGTMEAEATPREQVDDEITQYRGKMLCISLS